MGGRGIVAAFIGSFVSIHSCIHSIALCLCDETANPTDGGGGGVTRADMGIWTYLRFRDLQVPDLDTASSEVRDFEFDVDRPLCLALPGSTHATSETTGHATTVLVVALYGRQTQLCAHEELLASAELLDLPDDGGLLGRVVHGSDVGAETG